ncbi:polysaccharide biosynthesis tyrosine autokinase [Kocuria rhizosphaericola]|uniref:polysaccharide biosynthesis tyrosine autokinase n=1 Tax=Kocuria rhizosphaericola TaxID=3376284 RepID=UPI0037A655B6
MEHIHSEREIVALGARRFYRVVRIRWRAITLITLLCTLLALSWTLLQPKTYTSSAIGLVVTNGVEDMDSALDGDGLAKAKAINYGSLAHTRPVAEEVINRLQLDAVPDTVLARVTVGVPPETAEIIVTARAESSQEAKDLADTWLEVLANRASTLESESTTDTASPGAEVVIQPFSAAYLPPYPSAPNVRRQVAAGMLLGLALGLFYAFVRFRLDKGIRSAEDIRDGLGLPVLGVVPREEQLMRRPSIVEADDSRSGGGTAYVEAFGKLRVNLSFGSQPGSPGVIVITSPLPGEGKSSITANLAVAIASTGRNVVVIDGDLRQPAIAGIFGIAPAPGLADVLKGQIQVDEALQTDDKFPNLRILGAGHGVRNPSKLLSPEVVQHLLETLAASAMVLVDAPPVLPVADAALLTAAADGAILVANTESTTTDVLNQALETLDQVHGTVLGIVLNQVPTTGPHAMDFGYYGQYSSQGTTSSSESSDRGGW